MKIEPFTVEGFGKVRDVEIYRRLGLIGKIRSRPDIEKALGGMMRHARQAEAMARGGTRQRRTVSAPGRGRS